MVFKNVVNEMQLDSQRLPQIAGLAGTEGFAIALYIHGGIDNKANTLLTNHAGVSFTTTKTVEKFEDKPDK